MAREVSDAAAGGVEPIVEPDVEPDADPDVAPPGPDPDGAPDGPDPEVAADELELLGDEVAVTDWPAVQAAVNATAPPRTIAAVNPREYMNLMEMSLPSTSLSKDRGAGVERP